MSAYMLAVQRLSNQPIPLSRVGPDEMGSMMCRELSRSHTQLQRGVGKLIGMTC